jgi:hypothetical protein
MPDAAGAGAMRIFTGTPLCRPTPATSTGRWTVVSNRKTHLRHISFYTLPTGRAQAHILDTQGFAAPLPWLKRNTLSQIPEPLHHTGTNPPAPALYPVMKFLLWCILLVFCWPLALVALVLYPLVWLLLLPFRIIGIAVEGALELVWAIVTLPARLLRAL